MPLIQVDLPEDVDTKVAIYKITHKLSSKQEAIVEILKKFVDDDEKIGGANERKGV